MFGFLGLLLGWLGDAAIAALQATVIALQWAVAALWAFATSVYNGMIALGSHVLEGFQKAWDFLKATYEDVLKPAWDKLSQLFNRVRAWLNETFGPIIRALKSIRKHILDFYAQWIRPVMQAIDAARSILKILEALHIAWATALDNALGTVEGWVNEAFQLVLSKLNGVINTLNAVVTGELLFKRVPFLMTLKRDISPLAKMLAQSRTRKITDDERYKIFRSAETQTPSEVVDETIAMFDGGASEFVGPLADVYAQKWADMLGLDAVNDAAV